ncbi:shikimate dehydrogenase [Clostridiisalibacter paucivorans]|uniref:shikimate dehydrogenase n=1 Tax=Clostridiisalibacter paucivorans TaxID=408753 RepID=UPI000478F45A|nr:shikimate dehydrogenase [Clostridiisalibacter paucivorans]
MSNIFGLVGESLSHTFSPNIHKIILKKIGIKGYYNLFEIKRDNLDGAIYSLNLLGIKGVNVTIPYKESLLDYLSEISPEAKEIGAINTIDLSNEQATGYNTDYFGFGTMLKRFNIMPNNKKALILGTGGASKSVLTYLINNNVSDITLVSRNPSNVMHKFENIRVISYDNIKKLNALDMIINCTPCGMYPDENCTPISKELMQHFNIAIDLIYNPLKTKFLSYAQDLDIKHTNGLYMLIAQAVKSQEIWNNIDIPFDIIDEIYNEVINLLGDKNEK